MKEIVLIHGALGAAKQFDDLYNQLKHQYRVLTYEIPGHGLRSNEKVEFTIQDFANDFHSWLSNKVKQPVVVFGFSMGGYISLYLSLAKPELFEHIITLGTKFKWSVEEAEKEVGKLNPELLEQKVPQYATYLESLHGSNWKTVVLRTGSLMKSLGSQPLLNPETAKGIKVKTTFMLGELDKMVTKDETVLIKEAVPNAAFISIPEFVHPLEKLDALALANGLQTVIEK